MDHPLITLRTDEIKQYYQGQGFRFVDGIQKEDGTRFSLGSLAGGQAQMELIGPDDRLLEAALLYFGPQDQRREAAAGLLAFFRRLLPNFPASESWLGDKLESFYSSSRPVQASGQFYPQVSVELKYIPRPDSGRGSIDLRITFGPHPAGCQPECPDAAPSRQVRQAPRRQDSLDQLRLALEGRGLGPAAVLALGEAVYNGCQVFFGNLPHASIDLDVAPGAACAQTLSAGHPGDPYPLGAERLDLGDKRFSWHILKGAPYALLHWPVAVYQRQTDLEFEPARLLLCLGEDQAELEENVLATLLEVYFARYPQALEWILQSGDVRQAAYDPAYGFGMRFMDHRSAIEKFRQFITFIAGDPESNFFPGPGCASFDLGGLEEMTQAILEDLLETQVELSEYETSQIGYGAWLGLLGMEICELFLNSGRSTASVDLPTYAEVARRPLSLLYRRLGFNPGI